MGQFLHKKADIKFDWKKKFFTPPKDHTDGMVMMDVDADGNIQHNPDKIAEL